MRKEGNVSTWKSSESQAWGKSVSECNKPSQESVPEPNQPCSETLQPSLSRKYRKAPVDQPLPNKARSVYRNNSKNVEQQSREKITESSKPYLETKPSVSRKAKKTKGDCKRTKEPETRLGEDWPCQRLLQGFPWPHQMP